MPATTRASIAVVGGGVIGAATTRELSAAGVATVLYERSAGIGQGASYGTAGLLVPSHASPLASPQAVKSGLRWMFQSDAPFAIRPRLSPALGAWLVAFVRSAAPRRVRRARQALIPMAQQTLRLIDELELDSPAATPERRGTLSVYWSPKGLAAGRAEAEELRSIGVAATLLGAEETERLEPGLAPGASGAIHFPDDAHCDSHRFADALVADARCRGAQVRLGDAVIAIQPVGDRVRVVSATDEAGYDAAVVATGMATNELLRPLGARVPLQAAKGYHVDLAAGPGDPRRPISLGDSKVIATPLPGRVRLAGTLDLAGGDDRIDPSRVAAIRRAGEQALPCLAEREVMGIWCGQRPCVPDGVPLIGPLSRHPRVLLATGHGMLGLTLSLGTARMLRETLVGSTPELDPRPFAPARLGRTR